MPHVDEPTHTKSKGYDGAMRTLIPLLVLAALLGCAPISGPATEVPRDRVGEVDYSCESDTDCEVKDIGNCCGYYPACTNKLSQTFADQVQRECAKTGTAGICGFPSISGCRCVAKRCTNIVAGSDSQ